MVNDCITLNLTILHMNKQFPMKFKTLLLLCTIPAAAFAALPFTFQSGGVISASEMNSNFQALEARIALLENTKASASSLKYVTGVSGGASGNRVLRNDTQNIIEIISFDQSYSGSPISTPHYIQCDTGGPFFKSYIPPACALTTQQAGTSYTLVYR
jgi:hypothetical protein